MLLSLEIRNIVLIERLTVEFAPGLNVLTGETGAGKSILLDALGFALGKGGGAELVGPAGDLGSATAVFALCPVHPARGILAELGLEGESEGELVLRRVAERGGAARAFVNDQRASAETLRRLAATLVEVHGQRDERGLLDPRSHRPLLDAFGGLEREVQALGGLWQAAQAARRTLAEAEERLARSDAEAEELRHAHGEIARLAPEPGEAERLEAERRLMRAAARLGEEVARAAALLGEDGAEGSLGEALGRLARAAADAEGLLDEPVAALERAMVELDEARRGVARVIERLSFQPEQLEAVEERLFAIRTLARKHGVEPDALPALAEDLARRLAELDDGGGHIEALRAAAEAAEARYREAAAKLSEARQAAARRLDDAVTAELAPLRMERARFTTLVEPGTPGPAGIDEVRFTASINPGLPAGPIDRLASGGELARFLLALKVCLASEGAGRTMIFDEIDRGVGGPTADAVGRRLARLAAGGQTIVVTHSPQVAARGDHHWRITKEASGGRTRTRVTLLDEAGRIDELARMLAGARVSPEARAAAEALLSEAREPGEAAAGATQP